MKKTWRWAVLLIAGIALGACASTGEEERTTTTVSGGFVADEADMQGEVTDEEVERFAQAYIEVMAVQQQYHPRIQRAEPSERDALAEEGEEKVEAIIASYGMTTPQFNAIAVRLPLDEELRRRVQIEIQAQEEERLRILREEAELQE